MKCISVNKTLKAISSTYKKRIKKDYRDRGGSCKRLTEDLRGFLAEAIWSVEEPLEHSINERGGLIAEGAAGGKQVLAMRAARNALYDDLGHNEAPKVRLSATKMLLSAA